MNPIDAVGQSSWAGKLMMAGRAWDMRHFAAVRALLAIVFFAVLGCAPATSICAGSNTCPIAVCDRCSSACTEQARCTFSGGHDTVTNCSASSVCTGQLGDRSNAGCADQSSCTFSVGHDATFTCENASNCSVTAGDRASFTCVDGVHCQLTTGHDARLTCDRGAFCSFAAGERAQVICSNGSHCDVTCASCTLQCLSGSACTCTGNGCP